MAFVWKVINKTFFPNPSTTHYEVPPVDVSLTELPTLDVVLQVLPVIGELAKELSRGYSSRNPIYDFLGYTETAAGILQRHLTTIRESRLDSFFETDITKLANCLEGLFVDTVLDAFKLNGQSHDSHPRLRAVRDLTLSSESSSFTRLTLKYLAPQDFKGWRALSRDLASLTDRLQQVGHDVKDEKHDRRAALRRPGPELGDFIGHAISAMSCTCKPQSVRDMRLRLGTYKKPEGTEQIRVFTLLSRARESPAQNWAEVRVHSAPELELESHTTDIKFVVNNESAEPVTPVQPSSHDNRECICEFIQRLFRSDYWCLNVQLESHQFLKYLPDKQTKRTLTVDSLGHQVNLKALVSPKQPALSGMAKMTLSVILAYSLFYLYGRTSLKGRWNRENIIFFADGTHIPLRPFLKLPSQMQGAPPDLKSFHRYPEFLELGVTLLEIYFGESLESMLGSSVNSPDECLAAASEIFDRRQLDIMSAGFRQAIEICLKTDFNMGFIEDGEHDDDDVRNMLFECVVQPLEEDLESAFRGLISIDSLDEEASTNIKLPFASFRPETRPKRLATPTDYTTPPHHTRGRSSHALEVITHRRARSASKCLQKFELFNTKSTTAEVSLDAQTSTDDWMERFGALLNSYILTPANRLKVAILDTGIDLNHPDFFDGPIKERRSWVESPADVDICGHGTHIASTILTLSCNVDLYIAKITESNIIEKTDHIAEAIKVSSEEWDVDIISLSFGFPKGIHSIKRAIDEAAHRKKIVFAAASNDGANSARAYPARHDRVICIHSADGQGNSSKFNPTEDRKDDNFCVLGEHIEAAWPSFNPDELGETKRMSGTSFATPVAVAIAAFMITFVSQNRPEHIHWLIPLKSYSGMRTVFHELSESRDGQYDLVNPIKSFTGSKNSAAMLLDRIEEALDNE